MTYVHTSFGAVRLQTADVNRTCRRKDGRVLSCVSYTTQVAGMLRHLAKASDNVNNEMLLSKYYSYGIQEKVSDLFRCIFTDRKRQIDLKSVRNQHNPQLLWTVRVCKAATERPFSLVNTVHAVTACSRCFLILYF